MENKYYSMLTQSERLEVDNILSNGDFQGVVITAEGKGDNNVVVVRFIDEDNEVGYRLVFPR